MRSSAPYTLVFLFTSFPPEVSGTAQYNWERVQWFARQELYQVVVLAPDYHDESSLPAVPSDLREKLTIEGYPSKPWLPYKIDYVPTLGATRHITKRLMHYRPDLIVVVDVERLFLFSTWQFPGRRFAKHRAIPYITEFRTDYYNFANSYPVWKILGYIFLRPLITYMYSQFDVTLVSSKFAGQRIQQMGIPNPYVTSFVGIDVSAYSPKRRSRNHLTQWLSSDEQGNNVILYLGRIAFEKRIDLLIEAFLALKARHTNVSLIIAGDGPDHCVNALKRLSEQSPHVHFTGFIHGETKANLLASCDVFCSPSPYETFGRTIVEAMASGIPVVTVNSGAVTEYIINRVNGYLVQPDNVSALVDGMERVLTQDCEGIAQKAVDDAKRFSVERGCQNLNAYYQTLLGLGETPSVRSLSVI
ncbi:MAG: glycosyltransferase [Elainellaceae cyanobacterium]